MSFHLQSCITFNHADGSKMRYINPATDHIPASAIDTTKYIRKAFKIEDYQGKTAYTDSKRIVVPLTGKDMKALAATGETYYAVPYNPTCPASIRYIEIMDSLSKVGYNILPIGYRRDYEAINRRLGHTNFAAYPYYTIEDERYTDILVIRELKFFKEANPEYYRKYRDDLLGVSYLLIENGTITPVFYNDEQNILK